MDRSFLRADHDDSGLAAAIVALGKSLNLDVVAEGIELPEQIVSLRDLGCELGQGFLFAKPMPYEALSEYLDARRRFGLARRACSIVTRGSTAPAASPGSTSSLRSPAATSASSGRG